MKTRSKHTIYRFIVFLLAVMLAEGLAPGQIQAGAEDALKKEMDETRKVAEAGNADAQFKLGNFHYLGQGGKADSAQAKLWFEKAAQQDHVEAQASLGVLLYMGASQEQDVAKAVEWFQKAAQQGHPGARKHLGILYDTGQGVRADPSEAARWYGLAAASGHPDGVRLLERAVELSNKANNPDHVQTQALQEQLAQARKGAAEPVNNPLADLSASLNQAVDLQNQGLYDKAHPLLSTTCGNFLKVAGDKNPETGWCFNRLAVLESVMGRMNDSEATFKKALAIQKGALPENHADILGTLSDQAELLRMRGRFKEARAQLEGVLGKSGAAELAEVRMAAKGNLAKVHEELGNFEDAVTLTREILDFETATLGNEHPNRLTTLNNLAGLKRRMGDFAGAEKDYRQALEGFEKVLGAEHPATITMMNNLATTLESEGLFDQAEPMFSQAWQASEKVLGKDHPTTMANMNNLAMLYESQGVFEKAEALYNKAISLSEAKLGASHPDTIAIVNNLGYLYLLKDEHKEAAKRFQRVLTVWQGELGEKHQKTLKAMNNLARAEHKAGQVKQAETLFLRALLLRKEVLGAKHPDVLRSMHDLAALYRTQKRTKEARELLKTTLALDEEVLGKGHPYTFETLNTLAGVMEDGAALQESFPLRQEGFQRRTDFLNRMLWVADENAREGYIRLHAPELSAYLSLLTLLQPDVGGREALDVSLQRKGLLLKITSEIQQVSQIAKDPALTELTQKLAEARKELASLTLSGPTPETKDSYIGKIRDLGSKVNDIERRLGQASQRYRHTTLQYSVDQVVSLLPPKAALVDFLVFNQDGKSKLMASTMVVENGKPAFNMVVYPDLDQIQKGVLEYRTIIQSEEAEPEDVMQVGQKVYDLVWGPIVASLGDREDVYLVPDGILNILPFNALVAPDEKYLIQKIKLHILSSGRDIFPSSIPEAKGDILIVAGPDYDSKKVVGDVQLEAVSKKRAAAVMQGLRGAGSGMRGLHFDLLPGAEKEGKLITDQAKDKGQKNQIYTQNDAQEKLMQGLSSPPRVVHVATHGFFLKPDDSLKKRLLKLQRGADIQMPPPGDNPLLRAGLAFAGINANAPFLGELDTVNDGVLTALEVLGLHLEGTQLAVLSACETGLGEIHEGEGVYGLRRAFMEAGVQSVVSSLWEVSDAGTQNLMTRFYGRLMAGQAVDVAMRESQLELLKSSEWSNPYIWSAFMLVGK
ncbi:MAG: TPR REGION protein [Magnetococcales bacterium]|nr:TPR REGION protein [Magnetococcales bacterium]HIJ82578.1 tetratricopeptide repeat protein [Magnetococcales bacterium]